MPDAVWSESNSLPRPQGASTTQPARQGVAELAQICREQAEELEAKEVIINHLKRKIANLEATVSTYETQTPENNTPNSALHAPANNKKRSAAQAELQEGKVTKTQVSHFLKAASEEMKSCIKWGGMLQVQFTISVTPLVFRKTFSGCKTYARAPVSSQEPGELVDDTSSVTMDRDDIVKVFGVAKAGRKFKYTGKGTVETLTVTYCASSKIAKGSGTWAFSDVA